MDIDYRDIVRLLFWPWLIVSTVILGHRRMNRRAERREQEASPPATVPRVSGPTPRPPARPATPEAEAPTSIALGPTAGAGGSVFDAPPEGRDGIRRPIAEMLAGISLPCDLSPLIDVMARSGAKETVVFVTPSCDTATAGRQIGAELRRLGFALDAHAQAQAVARRGGEVLHVAILSDAASIEREGRPAFRGVRDDHVVVEFWTE